MNGYSEPGTHPIPGWSDWRALVTPDGSDYEHYYDYRMNENDTLSSYGREPRDYLTDVITRHATRFIEQSAALRKPFFLYVGHHAPHDPAIAAPRHEGVYNGRPLPPRPNFNEAVVSDKPRAVRINPRMEESDKRHVVQLYRDRLESLLAVDESVQEIINSLRQTGIFHNTYVFFTSDNGFMLGEHRFVTKTHVYEESVRVPLLITGQTFHVVSSGRSSSTTST
jgi:arylsulfatase A-like enzyme